MLCDRCLFAVQQAADFDQGDADFRIGPHHATLLDLRQAKDDGCYSCSQLWKKLGIKDECICPY